MSFAGFSRPLPPRYRANLNGNDETRAYSHAQLNIDDLTRHLNSLAADVRDQITQSAYKLVRDQVQQVYQSIDGLASELSALRDHLEQRDNETARLRQSVGRMETKVGDLATRTDEQAGDFDDLKSLARGTATDLFMQRRRIDTLQEDTGAIHQKFETLTANAQRADPVAYTVEHQTPDIDSERELIRDSILLIARLRDQLLIPQQTLHSRDTSRPLHDRLSELEASQATLVNALTVVLPRLVLAPELLHRIVTENMDDVNLALRAQTRAVAGDREGTKRSIAQLHERVDEVLATRNEYEKALSSSPELQRRRFDTSRAGEERSSFRNEAVIPYCDPAEQPSKLLEQPSTPLSRDFPRLRLSMNDEQLPDFIGISRAERIMNEVAKGTGDHTHR